ncbi:MAG: phospholipase D-like domain-containing protein, partial [Sutterella sp.]
MENLNTTEKRLIDGCITSFVDTARGHSDNEYRPQFISNDPEKGSKVISVIEDELQRCTSFDISVAFVTRSGIQPLLLTLEELERRGVPGRVLTTDYLCFSEPDALRRLQRFRNIRIKLFRCSQREGFHTKGYIFQSNDVCRIILGSSNWTQTALST